MRRFILIFSVKVSPRSKIKSLPVFIVCSFEKLIILRMCRSKDKRNNNNFTRFQRCLCALGRCFELMSVDVRFEHTTALRGHGFALISILYIGAAISAFWYAFIDHSLAEHFGFKPMYSLCIFVCLIQVSRNLISMARKHKNLICVIFVKRWAPNI